MDGIQGIQIHLGHKPDCFCGNHVEQFEKTLTTHICDNHETKTVFAQVFISVTMSNTMNISVENIL